MTAVVASPYPWEVPSWLPGGDLPEWIDALRAKHAAALSDYHEAIGAAVDSAAEAENANRAHRRAVRDAVAAGKTPPARRDVEVDEAVVQVATEDVAAARRAVAEVGVEVLAEIRQRLDEFWPYAAAASVDLRIALGRGPDGVDPRERERRARIAEMEAEPPIVDLSNPAHAHLTTLNEMEAARAV